MTLSNSHDQITREFVYGTLNTILTKQLTGAEALVVFESIIYSMLETLSKAYKLTPQGSTELMEECLHQAIVRYAEGNRK